MPEFIFGLCAITALLCMYMLLRSYKKKGTRLLLWSGLCFAGLAINNILLVVDRLIGPSIDLSTVRLIPAVLGIGLLLYGLILEND